MEKYKADVNKSNAKGKKAYENMLVADVAGIKAFESQTLPYTVDFPSTTGAATLTCNKHATINAENMVAIKKQLNEKAKFLNYMFDGDVPFPNLDPKPSSGVESTDSVFRHGTIVPGIPDNIFFIIVAFLVLCALYLIFRPSSKGGRRPVRQSSDDPINYGYHY